MRFHYKEEQDQGAEQHELDVRYGRSRERNSEPGRQLVEEDREEHDEGGAKKRSQDSAEPPDDDHEQYLERAVNVERKRFPGAEPQEGPQRPRHADIERGHREGGKL